MKKENKTFFEFKVVVNSPIPVFELTKLSILSGRLKGGNKFAILREIGLESLINPNTIIKIYNSRLYSGYFYKPDKIEKVFFGQAKFFQFFPSFVEKQGVYVFTFFSKTPKNK